MAQPTDPSFVPPNPDALGDEASVSGLEVVGALPPELSGCLLGIGPGHSETGSPGTGDGVVHSVHLHAGRALGYRRRRVRTDPVANRLGIERPTGLPPARRTGVADSIVVFSGSTLALGDSSLAYELSLDLDTLRRVDLAGHSRGLTATPKLDPATGDLHLIAAETDGAQAHVVVSSGALTRRSRPILDPPHRVADLAITRDSVVFIASGFIGITSHDTQTPIRWIATGVDAGLVAAHDAGEAVVVYTVTPSLERWTVDVPQATIHREILDASPRRLARANEHVSDEAPRFLWAVGDGTLHTYDLATGGHAQHNFGSRQPGDLTFIADATRPNESAGGWLVGFVEGPAGATVDLVFLDAADIERLPIATVGLPPGTSRGLHTTWVPSSR